MSDVKCESLKQISQKNKRKKKEKKKKRKSCQNIKVGVRVRGFTDYCKYCSMSLSPTLSKPKVPSHVHISNFLLPILLTKTFPFLIQHYKNKYGQNFDAPDAHFDKSHGFSDAHFENVGNPKTRSKELRARTESAKERAKIQTRTRAMPEGDKSFNLESISEIYHNNISVLSCKYRSTSETGLVNTIGG